MIVLVRPAAMAGCVVAATALFATLTGCGGSQVGVGSPQGMPAFTAQRVTGARGKPSNRSGEEVLRATSVQIAHSGSPCDYVGPYVDWTNTFAASGTATGVFPGSFTASGFWRYWHDFSTGTSGWRFDESFTITSGSCQLTGSIPAGSPAPFPRFRCKRPPAFGRATFKYMTSNESGNAKIETIRPTEFNEALLKLSE
jgi:hypothetical protein